jgi:hypothetical protein
VGEQVRILKGEPILVREPAICAPCNGKGDLDHMVPGWMAWYCTPMNQTQLRRILKGDFHADPVMAAKAILSLPHCDGIVLGPEWRCPKCGRQHDPKVRQTYRNRQ